MSNPTSPPIGIYASRHAPKPTDPNRILPHMRKRGESPAIPTPIIKPDPTINVGSIIPVMEPRQGPVSRRELKPVSRLELNPCTAEFMPADARTEKPPVTLTPTIKSPTPSIGARSAAGNFSLSKQLRGMVEEQRAVIAAIEDEIVQKKDQVTVLRQKADDVGQELSVVKAAWRIVDEIAREV